MQRLPKLRAEKKRLLVVRDAALGPAGRVKSAAALSTAARKVFMAGMAARGFTPAEARAAWRERGGSAA
jgi:hypothetical protein